MRWKLLGDEEAARGLVGRASWLTGRLMRVLLAAAMSVQLCCRVPQASPRRRRALGGALLAAVLWETAKQAFTFYATYVGYGTGTEALGSTFGLIVAFVFWVYFSGVVLMIGAVVASLQEHRHVTAGELPGTELPAQLGLSPQAGAEADAAGPDASETETDGSAAPFSPPRTSASESPATGSSTSSPPSAS